MKILLACAGGMSSSLLERSVIKYMKDNNIEGTAIAYGVRKAISVMEEYDVLLLAPQVRYALPSILKIAKKTPVSLIPHDVYGLAKGDKIYKLAKGLIE